MKLKSIGEKILVKGGLTCDTDEWATIEEVKQDHYIVHIDTDPDGWSGPVTFDGEILHFC